MISSAVLLALAMQCAPAVHPDTSQDVARVESGFNPYAIGVVGQKGIFPDNINDALAHVTRLRAKGKNYSVGLMQINQANFSRYGVTARQLFNPCTNLTVFSKIITDCYRRGTTLKRALSCYYSGNFETGQKPEATFSQTSYVQRMGYTVPANYVVPSTQADKQAQNATADNAPPTPSVRYPPGIVRGSLMTPDVKASPNPATHFPAQILRGDFVATSSSDN
ncbi:lytic transglycosylase domain-containing protein [Serratia fonticola]|uniref:lytic transglycosylase domain-containing protein n=1 Tax=Serratia fonticola TaxID=47917 RepID=UPI00301E506A